MKINTIKYLLVDSLKSLKRNRTMSIASAATVTATLFILGVFLLTILNVKQGIKEVESKVEVQVFLKDNIKINEQSDIEKKINSVEGVKDTLFESRSQALAKLKEQLGENNKGLTDGLDKDNPMPNSFIIKVEKPEVVSNVVSAVKDMPGVDKIKDGRQVVDRIMTFSKTIQGVGIVIFIILIGVSLFLIGNTIKITVYSRRREINIMKYIGATDWFIRWPFIIEGMIIGLVGAMVSVVILFYAYKFIYLRASVNLIMVSLINPRYILSNIMWEFVVVGIAIGVLGSISAIRKFLTV